MAIINNSGNSAEFNTNVKHTNRMCKEAKRYLNDNERNKRGETALDAFEH